MQTIQAHVVILSNCIGSVYVLESHDKTKHFLLEYEIIDKVVMSNKTKRQFISQGKVEELIQFSENRALGMINDKIDL